MTYFSLSTDPDDSSPRCAPKCSGKDCACRSDQFLSRLPNAKHVKMGGGGGGGELGLSLSTIYFWNYL